MMERETGFEPATPTLATLCSTTELFPLGTRVRMNQQQPGVKGGSAPRARFLRRDAFFSISESARLRMGRAGPDLSATGTGRIYATPTMEYRRPRPVGDASMRSAPLGDQRRAVSEPWGGPEKKPPGGIRGASRLIRVLGHRDKPCDRPRRILAPTTPDHPQGRRDLSLRDRHFGGGLNPGVC